MNSGDDLRKLKTRDDVQASFGQPDNFSVVENASVETYETRRKIADPVASFYLATGLAMTSGLGEFIWFPHQSFVAVRRSIVGQHLEFTYDSQGTITAVKWDGETQTAIPGHEPAS